MELKALGYAVLILATIVAVIYTLRSAFKAHEDKGITKTRLKAAETLLDNIKESKEVEQDITPITTSDKRDRLRSRSSR